MNKTGLKMLSSYEKNIYMGKKPTKGDNLIKDKITAELIKKMLNIPFNMKLEDGTNVTATAQEFIIAAAIGDAIDKGSFDKVATMMKTTGELNNAVDGKIEISLVDKDLAKRALE